MTLQTRRRACSGPSAREGFGDKRQPPQAVRSAAAGGGGDDLGLPCGVARRWRCRVEEPTRRAHSPGFSAATICRRRWSTWRPAAAATACIPTAPNENRGGESVVSYLLGLAEIRQLARIERQSREACAASRLARLTTLRSRIESSRGRLVASHVPEPAGPLSAARSGAGRRAAVQAGDRAARPQPDRQDPGQPHRRPGAGARSRDGGEPAGRCARELSRAATAICWRHSRRAPTKWKTPSRRMPPSRRMQRQLVGAYFLHEYSFEASALFNPSIVAHPDQSGAPAGRLRFILSLRAVGEGHISSLTFRSGIDRGGRQRHRRSDGASRVDPERAKPDIGRRTATMSRSIFRPDEDISERVIFPVTACPVERHRGCALRRNSTMAARQTYYATYTAYSGRAIRSELIETTRFRVVPDVAAAAAPPRATRAWRCFRARSTAATR